MRNLLSIIENQAQHFTTFPKHAKFVRASRLWFSIGAHLCAAALLTGGRDVQHMGAVFLSILRPLSYIALKEVALVVFDDA